MEVTYLAEWLCRTTRNLGETTSRDVATDPRHSNEYVIATCGIVVELTARDRRTESVVSPGASYAETREPVLAMMRYIISMEAL